MAWQFCLLKGLMKIIGFGHQKRTGKDTATRFAMLYLRQHRPDLKSTVLSFGNVIKEVAYSMYSWGGLERADYYENNPNEIEETLPIIGKSPRQIWDMIGLTGRDISGKTWVELAMHGIDADILICKDVRGFEEFDLIKKVGGLSVKMIRDAAPPGGPVDHLLDHVEWDTTLVNNSDQRQLNLAVRGIVQNCLDMWFPLT